MGWSQFNLDAVRDMRDALLAEHHQAEQAAERELEHLVATVNTTHRTVAILNATLGTWKGLPHRWP